MRLQRTATALGAIGVLALLGVLFLERPAGAKRDPSVLRARAIELVDGRGQVRAQIKVEPNREVVFRLRDQDGAVRVKLGASRRGSGMVLLDEATEPGLHALAGARGTSLTLHRGEQSSVLVP